MPTLEDLDILKSQVNEMGDEPRITAARGERIQDVAPPEASVDADLGSLLDDEPVGGDDGIADGIDEMEALIGSYAEDMESDDGGDEGFDALDLDGLDPLEESGDESRGSDSGVSEVDDEDAADTDTSFDTDFETEPEPVNVVTEEDDGPSYELEELEDSGDPPDLDDMSDDTPDMDAAPDGLGDMDGFGDGEELSLDDELNFDEELGTDVLSDIRDVDDDSIQFSMDDFGDQYNFREGEDGFAEELGVDLDNLEKSLDETSGDEESTFSIEEADYEEILATLAQLPRNLKVALEETLADDRYGPDVLEPLIRGLIAGESPRAAAGLLRKISKRNIELPRSYEKKSGRALEAKRASLGYRLTREGWPVFRLIMMVIGIAWVLSAMIFMWVYRPLKADSLYRQGLDAIARDDISTAREFFRDARYGWPLLSTETEPDSGPGSSAAPEDNSRIADAPIIVKGWPVDERWLEYARALKQRKYWTEAEEFYRGYLGDNPGGKDARLEYAAFLSGVLGRYEDAVNLLQAAPMPSGREWDRDLTLAEADIFLQWGEDNPMKFEEARYRYAKALELSRNDERAILSMMRYHLRVGDDQEVMTLLPVFADEIPGDIREPSLAAEVFASLAEFHMERGSPEEGRRFVILAAAADPLAPEPAFADSRYWRMEGDEEREFEAYRRTLVNLEQRDLPSREDLRMRILSLGGMGRTEAARARRAAGTPSAAESRTKAVRHYAKSLDLYSDALNRSLLGTSAEFGQLYLEAGNLMFYGNGAEPDLLFTLAPTDENLSREGKRFDALRRAVAYYNQAETVFNRGDVGSSLPTEALFRRAYARRSLGDEGALVDFHRVVRRLPDNFEASLALGTALLEGGDYEASRSQYAKTLRLLDEELRKTGGTMNPSESPGHRELLLRYIAVWNNLGVGRAGSAARGGGEDDYAAALSAFTMASEYLDSVYSDMKSLIARGATALRDLDERRIYSESGSSGRALLEEKATYPYRNRLQLLGLTEEDDSPGYLAYSDIPSSLTAE